MADNFNAGIDSFSNAQDHHGRLGAAVEESKVAAPVRSDNAGLRNGDQARASAQQPAGRGVANPIGSIAGSNAQRMS